MEYFQIMSSKQKMGIKSIPVCGQYCGHGLTDVGASVT